MLIKASHPRAYGDNASKYESVTGSAKEYVNIFINLFPQEKKNCKALLKDHIDKTTKNCFLEFHQKMLRSLMTSLRNTTLKEINADDLRSYRG